MRVVIRTTDGREFEKQLDYPKGDPRNPLTDDEISGKFEALAEGIATAGDVERMQAAINRTEEFDDVRELMGELTVEVRLDEELPHQEREPRRRHRCSFAVLDGVLSGRSTAPTSGGGAILIAGHTTRSRTCLASISGGALTESRTRERAVSTLRRCTAHRRTVDPNTSRVAPLGSALRTVGNQERIDRETNMPQTITEKVVQAHAVGLQPGHEVLAGDMVTVRPSHVMTHDNTGAVLPKFRTIGADTGRRSVAAGLRPRPQRPGHERREPREVRRDRGRSPASRASSSSPPGPASATS